MKKVVGIIAVLALLLLTVGSVALVFNQSQDDEEPRSERTPRPREEPADPRTTEAPAPGLERFYEQSIDWQACESNDDHDCATIEVPVDYAEPDGETFDLNLLRVPASGEAIGSLVVNPGGPGAPGTTYASMAGYVFGRALREHYDIVGFDPRGTGESSPVDCLTDAELDDYISMDPDPDTQGEVTAFEQMLTQFGQGCATRTGDIVGHVTTIEAARDMDVLRAALGESALDYHGASYGTKLGATYAELFPDRVGRFVLDGAVDLSADGRTLSLEQAAGFEMALRAYVQNCIDSAQTCFLGDTVDEGMATIEEFIEEVDAQPIDAGQRQLEVGNAFYGIVAPLYNRDYWFLLSTALRQAMGGNGAQLLGLSDMYASRQGGAYTDNSMEANYVINCLDSPGSTPMDEISAEFKDFEKASPTFGRIFAWGMAGCSGFDVRSSEEPLKVRGEGAAPILVLGTTRDPATPMKWAESLADQLESGVLVERDGDGHTAYNMGNDCINDVVEGYLIEGTVPDDGTRC